MFYSISRRGLLVLVALAWFSTSGSVQADPPAMKISNVRINFHVEMSTLPTVPPPTAPWYAYFPADPRRLPAPNATPYPSWPMQFPPAVGPQMKSNSANVAPGPMLTQYWPSYYQSGSNLQPVGYTPPQAPSYWYRGR